MNKSIKKEGDHIWSPSFFGYFNVFNHFHWKINI
jgi:hypothetical protein